MTGITVLFKNYFHKKIFSSNYCCNRTITVCRSFSNDGRVPARIGNAKFRQFLIFITLMTFINLPASASDPRVVRIGAFNYYPGIFKDSDGVVKGFYVDALLEISRLENIKFEYVYGSWAEGLERIKSGEVDLLPSVAYTPERALFMDYTKTPLLTVWGELYVPLTSEIDDIMGLQGKKVAVMKGDFNAAHFRDLIQKFNITCSFVEVPGFEEVFNAIEEKKVDAGIVNNTYGVAKTAEHNLRSTGIVFNPFNIYFASSKGKNRDLLKLFDDYLNEWRHQKNSVYNNARQKWSHGRVGVLEIFPRWIIISAYILIGLIFLGLVFIVLLRRQVKRATKNILTREAKLMESESKFRSYIDSSPEGIFVADHLGSYLEVNPAASVITGYSQAELLKMSIRDLLPPESMETGLNNFKRLKEKGSSLSEYKFLHKNRTKRWWAVNATKLSDNLFLGFVKDITERKIAEAKLIESEERLRLAIESSPFPLMIFDEDNRVLQLSKGWTNYSGYTIEDIPTLLDWTEKAYGPRKVIAQEFISQLFLINHTQNNGHWEVTAKNGSKRIWDFQATPLGNVNEGKQVILSMATDITEQVKMQKALEESEQNFREIFDSTSEAFFIVDAATRKVIDVNQRTISMYGYNNKHEILEIDIEDISAGEDLFTEEKAQEYIIRAIKEGPQTFDWLSKKKNGEKFWTEVSLKSAEIGGEERILAVVRDNSERKLIEETQMFLLHSLNKSSNGDFFTALAGYLAKCLGMDYVCIDKLKGNNLIAQTLAIYFDGKFEDNVEYTLKETPCGDVVGKTICCFPEKVRYQFPNDVVLQEMNAESYIGTTLWSNDQQPIGLIAVIGRKPLENHRLAETILKLVAIRAASELERKEAEDKVFNSLKEKEILLKEIHHRVKNNFQIITSLLSLQAENFSDEKVLNVFHNSRNRIKSMSLIHELMYKTENFAEINLQNYISRLIDYLKISYFLEDIRINIILEIEEIVLQLDNLIPIGLIINELISNSFKHAFPDGRKGEIFISIKSFDDGRFLLSVRDNGIGLPKDYDLQKGKSLGMFLIGTLSKQINGELKLSSSNSGTETTVIFGK